MNSMILKNLKIKFLKENQIMVLNMKQELSKNETLNEKDFFDKYHQSFNLKIYQAIDYNDIVEKFIDSNENWKETRWLVYQ